MPDQIHDEWLTDFSAPHQTMADLERLLARAGETQDEELRRLVKVHIHLRLVVKDGLLPALSATKVELTEGQRSMVEMARLMVDGDSQVRDV